MIHTLKYSQHNMKLLTHTSSFITIKIVFTPFIVHELKQLNALDTYEVFFWVMQVFKRQKSKAINLKLLVCVPQI